MTVAETRHKRLVYRSTAFADKRGRSARSAAFLYWPAIFFICGGTAPGEPAVGTGPQHSRSMNGPAKTARTSRGGINLNRVLTIGETARYGMFTQ
jgi:hypothetical protein